MESFTELPAHEAKAFLSELEEHYGVQLEWDYLFFINTKRKVHMVVKDFAFLEKKQLRVNKFGLYLATREVDGLRLSIEGAQLVNPKRNFVEITKEQLKEWLNGFTLDVGKRDVSGYVIVKYGNDIVGCGKYKEGVVLNAVGKDRRIQLNMHSSE